MSQTGSFHSLLAPFVVDAICVLRFHIVRLLPFKWHHTVPGVFSLRAGKGDPCWGFLVNGLFEELSGGGLFRVKVVLYLRVTDAENEREMGRMEKKRTLQC